MKILKPCLIGAAGFLSIASSAALAQSSAATDVRCLLLSNGFAGAAKEAKVKEIAAAAKIFYLGRVSMLSPSQLQAAKRSLPKQLDAGTAGQLMNQCAQQMQTTGKNVESVLGKPAS